MRLQEEQTLLCTELAGSDVTAIAQPANMLA